MNYGIVKNGIIVNIIVCDSNEIASELGALLLIDGAKIGDEYISPPIPEPTPVSPAKLREEAYNTQATIQWDNDMLTVTQAAQIWQYYAAEGNTIKTNELTALIAEAKAKIREQYPDE